MVVARHPPGPSSTPRRARPSGSGCSPTFSAGGHDPVPRHRPQGRALRPSAARRVRGRHRLSPDPQAQAKAFADQGFAWLHVVDLDGAVAGRPVNREAVAAILSAVTIPVQLGGGIRDFATLASWLDAGVSRVILGTAASRDPDLVRQACQAFPGRVAVGIDVRNGRSRSRAGPARCRSRPSSWRNARPISVLPPSSIPTLPATASSRASTSRRRSRSPARRRCR